MVNDGYYRIEYLVLSCTNGVAETDQGIEIYVGKARFFAEIDSQERVGSQTIGWGTIRLYDGPSPTTIFAGRVELTVRDKGDLGWQQTDVRSDTIKLRIFSNDNSDTPVTVIKGAIWGNRITSFVRG
jgi:hypothetical protein